MAENTTPRDRRPPQNAEAEQAILGSILIDKEALFRVVDRLHPRDFYLETHRRLFEIMIELSERGQPLDIVSVSARLKEKNILEEIGGQSYLTKLVNTVPSTAHITHYAGIVHNKSVLRKLLEASYHIAQLGYKEAEDIDVLLDEAEQHIFAISHHASTQNFASLKVSLSEAFERIDRLQKNTGELRGLPTGFTDLDNMLSGLQKSDLIILAARPSLGKSAMALDIARHAAMRHKKAVGFFSLEMSQDQIVDRLIAAEGSVDLWKLRTGKLSSHGEYNDFTKIQTALGILSEAPLFIDDGMTSSVLQMRAMARRLQAEHDLGLVVVDYLQLIQPRGTNESMVQQITEISRSLKAMARELNVPVLALSQLSRAVEQRGGPPRLSDLRESGSLEQDADVVIFLHRNRNEDSPELEPVTEIHIAKHRNGPIGKLQLYFNKHSASFKNLSRETRGYESHDGEAAGPSDNGTPNDVPPPNENGNAGMGDIPS